MKTKSPKPNVKISAKKRTIVSRRTFVPPAYGIDFVDRQNNSNDGTVQGKFESPKDDVFLEQKKENRTGLPDKLKEGIENLSGFSMDDVKVHYNSDKPAQLHAHAYAQGTDIHLASGQEKHLPHEAWHLVQQRQGRVKPTLQMHGKVDVNNETGLEREADLMGAKALHNPISILPPFNAKDSDGRVSQQKSIEHNNGCGCSSCCKQPVPQVNSQNGSARATIQRCVSCGNSSCIKGEKCGYDRSMGGMFSSSSSSSALPVLPYGSSNAKKHSGKAFGTELEHPIPGQTLRLIGEGGGYKQEYTIPIPKDVHRGGVSGSGGGISSTGSSATSKGWSQHLSSQDDFGRVKSAMTDQINSQIMNNNFSEKTAVQLRDWLVSQVKQSGRISKSEYETLLRILMNRYYDQK